MSDRSIEVLKLGVTSHGELEANFIEVELRYNDGKMGSRRGYYLSANPYQVEGNWRTYIGFSGQRMFVEETNRFSAKRLSDLAKELLLNPVDLQRLVGSVCIRQKLTITSNPSPIQFVSHAEEAA